MPQRTFLSQLGQLALALLNATLVLALLLVFGLWLLLGRAQDFAVETAEAATQALGTDLGTTMPERAAALDATVASLSKLQARVDAALARVGTADSPAVTELAALRSDIQAMTATLGKIAEAAGNLGDRPAEAAGEVLSRILQGLAARLGSLQPASN